MDPLVTALMKQKQPSMSAAVPNSALPAPTSGSTDVMGTELPYMPLGGIANLARSARTLAPEAQALMKEELVRKYIQKFMASKSAGEIPQVSKSIFQQLSDAGQFAGDRTTGAFTEGAGGLKSLGGYLGKMMGR